MQIKPNSSPNCLLGQDGNVNVCDKPDIATALSDHTMRTEGTTIAMRPVATTARRNKLYLAL